jgi:DNA-binding NarL/FixJ family response regulator
MMDLQLPELSGLEATREILATRPQTAVLVLTMFEDDSTVHAAIAAGVVGYLLKRADGEDNLAAVHSAAAWQADVVIVAPGGRA